MQNEQIKINVRQGSETNLVITVSATATVLEVKQTISEQIEAKPTPSEMKLIYKGSNII